MNIEIKSQKRRVHLDVLVTPAMAIAWMATMIKNRNVVANDLIRIKDAIKRGEWLNDGNSIKFDVLGQLCDGQHRLLAIIETGIAVHCDVAIGFPEDAVKNFDCNHPRSLSAQIKMFGDETDNITRRGGYLKMCIRLLSGIAIPVKTVSERARWTPFFAPGINAMVDIIGSTKGVRNAPVAGALAFAFKTNPAAVTKFAEQVCSCEGLHKGDPALALHKFIFSDSGATGHLGGDSKVIVARKTLNLLSTHMQNKQCKQVTDNSNIIETFKSAYSGSASLRDLCRPWTS